MSVVTIGGKEVNLDPELLKFDEININNFLQKFSSTYNHFQEAHAESQYLCNKFEDFYDKTYAEKFRENRDKVNSDKAADLATKCEESVCEALSNMRIAKRNSVMIGNYLRSMERCFDSCKEYSYNLRKELTTLYGK